MLSTFYFFWFSLKSTKEQSVMMTKSNVFYAIRRTHVTLFLFRKNNCLVFPEQQQVNKHHAECCWGWNPTPPVPGWSWSASEAECDALPARWRLGETWPGVQTPDRCGDGVRRHPSISRSHTCLGPELGAALIWQSENKEQVKEGFFYIVK